MRVLDQIDTLRFATAGSVDDGKSTLIGRLLYEANGIFEDQLASLAGATGKHGHVPDGEAIDFALLTDGLIAEREQGITIDVAYRYFTTPKRRFIVADTPGHEQYTRNMITGSTTADLTIVLIDAQRGLTSQSRRHAILASLLRIPHIVVAVNKMDLVDYDQAVFQRLRDEFAPFLAQLNFAQTTFIPVSALKGDMLTARGHAMPWFTGATLLATLETTTAHHQVAASGAHFRFPVQRVAQDRFGSDQRQRGYQGSVIGGAVKVGEGVLVLPSRQQAVIAAIHTFDGERAIAIEEQAVTLILDRQLDISRGDMLVVDNQNSKAYVESAFSANLCWLDASNMDFGRRYWIKHTTRLTRAVIDEIDFRLDVNTLEHHPAAALLMNEIGQVRVSTQLPLVFDPYAVNRGTGAFVLIDDATNRTVAAGMILAPIKKDNPDAVTPP